MATIDTNIDVRRRELYKIETTHAPECENRLTIRPISGSCHFDYPSNMIIDPKTTTILSVRRTLGRMAGRTVGQKVGRMGGRMDGQSDGRMVRQVDRQPDGRTFGWTDGWTVRVS